MAKTAREILMAAQRDMASSLEMIKMEPRLTAVKALELAGRLSRAIGEAIDTLYGEEIQESEDESERLKERLQEVEEELAEAQHALSTAEDGLS